MSLCFLSFDSGKIFNKLILEYVTNSGFDGLSEALILLFPYINEHEKVTAAQLAKIVGYSRQAMHKNIKKLKELDYITIIEENQKEKSIKITDKGRKLMDAANQFIIDMENNISEFMGEEELNLYKKSQIKIYKYLNTISNS